jgi:TolA-binding protein
MQAQDATTIYLLKLWPKIEANRNRIIAGTVILLAALVALWVFAAQQAQKETRAGQALTALTVAATSQPETYLKFAADYSGTGAGQRALLQAATMLFSAGKYADAQTQFQKFLDEHPDSDFSSQAGMGVAVCLEAQGKTDQAVGRYQSLVSGQSDPVTASMAKLALGRINEQKGHLNEAAGYYQDVARSNPNSSLGNDAMWRLMELKNKAPSTSLPATAPSGSFKLSQ